MQRPPHKMFVFELDEADRRLLKGLKDVFWLMPLEILRLIWSVVSSVARRLATVCGPVVVEVSQPLVQAWSTGWRGRMALAVSCVKWTWRVVLRRCLKGFAVFFVLCYVLAPDDLFGDRAYAGYLDDLVVATLALKLITPAPKKRKPKRRRFVQLPVVRANGDALPAVLLPSR